jgi:hypothetical protein
VPQNCAVITIYSSKQSPTCFRPYQAICPSCAGHVAGRSLLIFRFLSTYSLNSCTLIIGVLKRDPHCCSLVTHFRYKPHLFGLERRTIEKPLFSLPTHMPTPFHSQTCLHPSGTAGPFSHQSQPSYQSQPSLSLNSQIADCSQFCLTKWLPQ